MNRRIPAAVLVLACLQVCMAEQDSVEDGNPRDRTPIFRAGLLSDTHITDDPASLRLVRQAMALFDREGVDLVCHLGDLADVYSPQGFVEYRRVIEETFRDRVPETYYAFGGHDRNRYTLKPGETNREETVWSAMRQVFKVTHGLYDIREHAGYPFVIIQEYLDENRARRLVEKAVADYPGRPVFVLMHEPAWNTTYDSVGWGNVAMRRICDDFPQVVHLSGHAHGCNRNERMIWQGRFTEVNVGCLDKWGGVIANVDRRTWGKLDDGVLTMEVYADRIVFRRFSVTTGKEYKAENPWTVPLPHDPSSAPFRTSVRQAASPVPDWPEDAHVDVCIARHPSGVRFRVPEAAHPDGTYRYTLQLFSPDGTRVTLQQSLGNFWMGDESRRTKTVSFFLDDAFFSSAGTYRAEVRAEDFFGHKGPPLTVEFAGPCVSSEWREVWRTDNAMRSCSFSDYDWTRRLPRLPEKDDFFTSVDRMPVLELPADALSADDPIGTRYRLEMVLDDRHESNGSWRLDLCRGDDLRPLEATCLLTAEGSAGSVTYVFRFVKTDPGTFPVAVVFSYGMPKARFRVGRLAVSAAGDFADLDVADGEVRRAETHCDSAFACDVQRRAKEAMKQIVRQENCVVR